MSYLAGTETRMRVTDLVWKLAHVSGFSLFAASGDEQAEAYATVLPLIAGGQIAPARRPVLPARACRGPGWFPSHAGTWVILRFPRHRFRDTAERHQ